MSPEAEAFASICPVMWVACASSVRPDVLRSSRRPSPRVAFSAALRSSRTPVSVGDDLALPETRGSRTLRLRHVDAGVEIDLVAAEIAVEPRRAVRSARQEIGEAEAAAGRRARGAGQAEVAAGHAVEHRIGGREMSSHARRSSR